MDYPSFFYFFTFCGLTGFNSFQYFVNLCFLRISIDMDAETYECFRCSRHSGSDVVYPGVCSHLKTSVDVQVHQDHEQCTGNNDNVKPSIGANGQFCSCYKPQSNDLRVFQMNTVDYEREVMLIEQSKDSADTPMDGNESSVTYLSAEDFLYGTYRITTPGTYVLTEDIELNFNAPSQEIRESEDFSPNDIDALYWYGTR